VDQHAARLGRVAELLGLTGLLDRKPGQLSGGQQQRVALGRAIIAQHPVCLMDEPLSNLDAQLRQEMRREIRALQRKLGFTMIYVTHDQTEAMSMADQVILMRDGRIEQDAPPEDLYARPATAFAARFIGTPPMNVLRLAPGPDGAVVDARVDGAAAANPPVHANAVVSQADPARVELGIRPEHIRLTGVSPAGLPMPAGDAGLEAGTTAMIETCEYFGADTILSCRVGEQAVAVRVPGKHELAPSTSVSLAWRKDAQHFFDAADGRGVAAV
ncbi:MAG: ABC transporter ATP-binding protein, partial [Lautropia sp.]